jgi:hypothetical protein
MTSLKGHVTYVAGQYSGDRPGTQDVLSQAHCFVGDVRGGGGLKPAESFRVNAEL